MAIVKCSICGKGVRTTGGNYVFANGLHQHKKNCIHNELKPDDSKDRRELTDCIAWLVEHQGKAKLSPAKWSQVTNQIKLLCEQGYSYKDQLYAFKWYFDDSKKNEYIGYGIVAYIIEEALKARENEKLIKSAQIDMKALNEYMERKRKERLEIANENNNN